MIFVTALTATLFLLVAIIFVGRKIPSYSHWNKTISELGEKGSPLEKQIGFGIFLPAGLAILFCGVAYAPISEPISSFSGLCYCVAVGYVLAAFFPCDVGSPLGGSTRQLIHNLAGFVEYVGGAYFLRMQENEGFQYASLALIVGAIFLSFGLWRGFVQRLMEAILFFSICYLSAP